MENSRHDIIIIGAGPSGINCAIEASLAGLSSLILEKGVLVNSLYHFPTNMTFFSTSKKLEIGGIPFISHTDKPTRKEALEYYRRLVESYELSIRYNAEVVAISKQEDGYNVQTKSGEHYFARHIIVNTGFYGNPNKLNIPGEDLPKVKHYYDEAHPYIGRNIVVVGGANSACDVALETWQKGANVTMIVRQPTLYHKVKYWILPNIQNRIAEGSIKAHFSSELVEVSEASVTVNTPDGTLKLDNDYVLAMTGYKPDYSFLENIGIEIQDDEYSTPVYDDSTFESNLPNVYLSGVILGGLHTSKYFIENTRDQGKAILTSILSKQ